MKLARVKGKLREQGAIYVDKILKGAKPSESPITQPTKLVMWLNARTAREVGVALSPAPPVSADEVLTMTNSEPYVI